MRRCLLRGGTNSGADLAAIACPRVPGQVRWVGRAEPQTRLWGPGDPEPRRQQNCSPRLLPGARTIPPGRDVPGGAGKGFVLHPRGCRTRSDKPACAPRMESQDLPGDHLGWKLNVSSQNGSLILNIFAAEF